MFLEDVAQVKDGPELPAALRLVRQRRRRHGDKARDEFPAVTLAISKKAGENAVDVAEHLMQRVEQLKGSVIPEGVEVSLTRNYGETANDKAMKLIQKLIFATLSVVVLVWAALGRREAVIVGAAVILTLAATLFASWAWGFTLNRVSLFALIFSIGILVDDAIVVVENIHRRGALPEGPLALIPGGGGRSRRPDHTRDLHRDRGAAADGLRHRPDGPVHEPDSDQRQHGHDHLARDRVHRHALARAEAAQAACRSAAARKRGDRRTLRLFRRVIGPFLGGAKGGAARTKLYVGILVLILGSGVARGAEAGGAENAAVRQQVGVAGGGGHAHRHAAGADLARAAGNGRLSGDGAGSHRLSGLRRHQRADQLQRPGAAVLPAPVPELGDIQVNLVDKHHRSRKSHEIALACGRSSRRSPNATARR